MDTRSKSSQAEYAYFIEAQLNDAKVPFLDDILVESELVYPRKQLSGLCLFSSHLPEIHSEVVSLQKESLHCKWNHLGRRLKSYYRRYPVWGKEIWRKYQDLAKYIEIKRRNGRLTLRAHMRILKTS